MQDHTDRTAPTPDACHDIGSTFCLKRFLNGGELLNNPENRRNQVICFYISCLVVYLGHGILHPVLVLVQAVFFIKIFQGRQQGEFDEFRANTQLCKLPCWSL